MKTRKEGNVGRRVGVCDPLRIPRGKKWVLGGEELPEVTGAHYSDWGGTFPREGNEGKIKRVLKGSCL